MDALSRRSGVDAVVVVGRDGLPIAARTTNGVDSESVAALLPAVINAMTQLGEAGARGDFGTAVLEFGRGLVVVTVVSADALLVVLVQPHDAVGARLRKDDADVRKPEGVVRTREALDHHLRHRAALDDAGDVDSWLKLRGIRWRLRED